MHTVLIILGWSAFALAVLAGLVLDVLGLFGNWIIVGATAIAWAVTGFEHFSITGLLIMAGLAVLGEVLESAAAGYGASRFGGGKGTAVAAIVGCILGAIAGTPLFPIIGTLAGACLGAFAAAALYEYIQMEKEVRQALWTGLGAALGKVLGLFAKVLVGLAILVVAALTY
ncbi:MAG: DUF456 domain-containing protein [Candidatus Hydrogenedentes bacterium]|nr:DUF456 domain-containing protein [Candidatus Hydrogenedentota bacterium]